MFARFKTLLRHVFEALEVVAIFTVLWIYFSPRWSASLHHLLRLSWRNFLLREGSTGTGFISPIIVSLASVVATLLFIGYLHGREAMLKNWWETTAITTLVTVTVLLAVYGPQFVFTSVQTAYESHQILVNKNEALERKLVAYGDASKYHLSRNNPEFGNISDTTIAFAQIANPAFGTEESKRPCRVEITAPKENDDVRRTLDMIAASVGCVSAIQNSVDIDPRMEVFATTGAIYGYVLIHMPKDYNERGFITSLGNIFSVKRTYEVPPSIPRGTIWIQIGPGSVWRRT